MKKLPKWYIEQWFKLEILPEIIRSVEQRGVAPPAWAMRCTAWDAFTSDLVDDGLIWAREYSVWTYPRCCLRRER